MNMDKTELTNPFIAKLRREYTSRTLDEKDVTANPIVQFNHWFEEAVKAEVPEPNAMAIATTMVDFKPSVRMVLLKGVEEGGFVFFTNYQSRKGTELMWNPYGSLLFFWHELERQVRIEGRVEKISAEESTKYFHSRPRGSQIGTHVSPQSTVIESREVLEKKMSEMESEFNGKEIERPTYWGGYKLLPNVMEFWQGRASRLHDRIRYTLVKQNEWKIERLAP